MITGLVRQKVIPKTVIDVGANVGQFAVAANKLFPDVILHAFEPLPECVKDLQRHLKKFKNSVIYDVALGNNSRKTKFNVNRHKHSSSILPLAQTHKSAFPNAVETSSIKVTVSTLDEIFKDFRPLAPVLLKLDVQGYESKVLNGGKETLKKIDYVILESSFKPMYEGEVTFETLIELMRDHGFKFQRPVGFLRNSDTGEFLQIDALFSRIDC